MKQFKRILLVVLVIGLLSACGPIAAGLPVIQGSNPGTPIAANTPIPQGNDPGSLPATVTPISQGSNPDTSQATGTSVAQGDNPYAPQPGDGAMLRNEVKIDSASLSPVVSQPGQVELDFAYLTPTPCHKLRVEVGQPDAQMRIDVSAYAVAVKRACPLMALATALQASLDLGSFPHGHYSVWLNGVKAGEFDT